MLYQIQVIILNKMILQGQKKNSRIISELHRHNQLGEIPKLLEIKSQVED